MRHWSRALAALALLVAGCRESTGPELGPLAKVNVVAGEAQTAQAGAALPAPLVVVATDEAGHPLPGQVINFVVVSGGGSTFAPTAMTNADGKAQNLWTLGTTAGQPQKVEVRAVDAATGTPIVYATFTATVTAGAPAQVVKLAGDAQSGSVAAPLADSLQVKVLDSYGNPVPGATVAWSSADGGVLSPATSTTRTDGTTKALWTTGTHLDAAAAATVSGTTPVHFTATTAVTAATNAVITKLSGEGQTVTSGALVEQPLIISVQLPDGRPIVGARAGFRMSWSTGASTWTGVTGDNGVVALRMVVSAPSGPTNLVAAVFGPGNVSIIGTPVPFALAIAAGAPTRVMVLGKEVGDGLVTPLGAWMPGTALTSPGGIASPLPLFPHDSVEALVQDASGSPVSGVTVTWSTAGGAVVRPASSVTGVDGRARTHLVVSLVLSRIYARVGGVLVDSAYVVPELRSVVTLGASPTALTLAAGTTGEIVVRMNGKDVDSDFLTWTSSDPAVATAATVNPRGIPAKAMVSALTPGTTTLTGAIGTVTVDVIVTVTP